VTGYKGFVQRFWSGIHPIVTGIAANSRGTALIAPAMSPQRRDKTLASFWRRDNRRPTAIEPAGVFSSDRHR
jgi:hypothetical protein